MKKIFRNILAIAIAATTFTACEDVPAPYDVPTPAEKEDVNYTYTGNGSLSDPYTCTDAIQLAESLDGNESDNEVYIKGKIASITEEYTTQYGNGTFTISNDGTAADEFTVYRAYYLGNKKFASGNTQIKVGDEVIVYGKVVNFKGNTPETVQGSAYLYSLNGETGASQSPDTPGEIKTVSIAEFNAAAESNDVWYQLTGTVKNLKDGDLYGNFDLEDATGSVYVYGVLSEKNGEKKQFQELVAAKGIKNGSKLTIIGNRGSYNDKIEVLNAYFVSVEEGDTPDTPSSDVKSVSIAEFNAAAESNDVWYQLTGTVKNLKDGDQYGNFDLEDATGSVYVYGVLSEKGGAKKLFQELVEKYGIKNGSKLTIIGNRGSYNGKIEVLNAYFVSTEGGDTPDTPTADKGTKDNPFTVAEAIEAAEAGTAEVYVKGIISQAPKELNEKYGSLTYYISDDGKQSNELQIYSGLYFNSAKFTSADQLKSGDEVIVVGKLKVYKGQAEMDYNNYIYSLNGKTSARRK